MTSENTESLVNAFSFRETCPARSVFNELVPSFPSPTSRVIASRRGRKKRLKQQEAEEGGTRDGAIFFNVARGVFPFFDRINLAWRSSSMLLMHVIRAGYTNSGHASG